jgi:hypothetical protein
MATQSLRESLRQRDCRWWPQVSSGIKSGNRPDDAQATCTNHEWMPLHIRASGDTRSHAITYTDPAQVVFVVFYI